MSYVKKKVSRRLLKNALFSICLIVVLPIPEVSAQTVSEIRANCVKKYPGTRSTMSTAAYILIEECVADGIKKTNGPTAQGAKSTPSQLPTKTEKKEVRKLQPAPKQSSRPSISDGE